MMIIVQVQPPYPPFEVTPVMYFTVIVLLSTSRISISHAQIQAIRLDYDMPSCVPTCVGPRRIAPGVEDGGSEVWSSLSDGPVQNGDARQVTIGRVAPVAEHRRSLSDLDVITSLPSATAGEEGAAGPMGDASLVSTRMDAPEVELGFSIGSSTLSSLTQ